MKSADTIVEDIYGVLTKGADIHKEDIDAFGSAVAKIVDERLNQEREHRPLRLSSIGEKCDRKTWFRANTPELAEPLQPWTRLKFLYGDIIEALLLFLARAAGHKVSGEQDTIEIGGVKGHRDGVLDGRIIDVKSASTYGFKKFASNGLRGEDPFGYLSQIGSYSYGSRDDLSVTERDVHSFLAMDKSLGHLVLDTYPVDDTDYEAKVQHQKDVIAQNKPPKPYYFPEPEGKSGNLKLGTECSYCCFKRTCWSGLRSFAYSTGPVHLVKVVKEPKVPEILPE